MYPYLSFPPLIVFGTKSSGNPAFSLRPPAPSTHSATPSAALRATANLGQASVRSRQLSQGRDHRFFYLPQQY
jgi:hypothetical protein